MDLTVIIPVYNVAKYIEKCILSVVNNDLENGYEIIVVDDGSPDNSVKIVKGMMELYPHIVLLRQENRGLGGARNAGIQKAKGRYVLFLDADDFLKDKSLLNVLEHAKINALDILEFGAVGISEEGTEVYINAKSTEVKMKGSDYLASLQYMDSACNKLYSLQFLNERSLRFRERIYIEDYEFNTRAFYFAQSVQAIDIILGCFVQSRNSITRNSNTAQNLKMVRDIEKVISMTVDFEQKEACGDPSAFQFFSVRKAYLTVTLLLNLLKLSIEKEQRNTILDSLIKNGLYPVTVSLKDRKKNFFRVFANHKRLYLMICFLKDFMNSLDYK